MSSADGILRERSSRHYRSFYFYMAAACAAVAILGFAPTYWAPMITGKLTAPPVIHLHGAVFFIWAIFVVWQVWLASSGRIASHRNWGMVGIALATAMTIFGVLASIRQMQNAAALGFESAGKEFAIVPLGGIVFFAVTFILAIKNVSRPEWHKRLMTLATISILDAPVARWFMMLLAPASPPAPPPVAVDVLPALTASLLVAVAVLFDWRTRGRPHGVYLIGGIALIALKLLQVPISQTSAWHSIANWVLGLAG